MTHDALRREFEAWFEEQGLWRAHSCAKDRKPTGEYIDNLAEKYWQNYQKDNNNV